MSEPARPRGLGRGLSALLGEPVKTAPPAAALQPLAPSPNVVELPVGQPYQPPQSAAPNSGGPPSSAPPPSAPQSEPMREPTREPQRPAQPSAQSVAHSGGGEGGPRQLPIDLVQRNPSQPRKHFDEADLTDLANSIRHHGVLQPILVRPIAGGRYEIVAGERRWRAAQRAGLHVIPAIERDLDELEVLEIAIVENVQRTDLNPIEEAQGFQALIDRFGRTQQDIADAVGKSRPHIANMLRLLALPEDLQAMVCDGRLTAGHARAILTAPDPRALAAKAIAENLNVREIERLAAQAKDDKHGPRVTSSSSSGASAKDADTLSMERSISDALGLPVVINDKSGAGDIRISYRTLEQLDDLARRLRGGG